FQVVPKFDEKKCIKCGRCGKICKVSAIVSLKDRYPVFVENLCNGCGACMITCPTRAITKGRKKVGEIFTGKHGRLSLVSAEIMPGYFGSDFVVEKEISFAEDLRKGQGRYSMTFVDTAAGTHCNVISALKYCELALAVTEPTPLGAHDLDLILNLCRTLKVPASIILNRSDIGDRSLIERIAAKYNTGIIAEIPHRKRIMEAYSRGEPIEDKALINILQQIIGNNSQAEGGD
ncbi:P-loop ATPase, partial [Candidatus Woesearchaeota archaeon]|nr:P-loop ATPase [Candidatus Woesearchaeota archaeon]